jgi:hypothetical protein
MPSYNHISLSTAKRKVLSKSTGEGIEPRASVTAERKAKSIGKKVQVQNSQYTISTTITFLRCAILLARSGCTCCCHPQDCVKNINSMFVAEWSEARFGACFEAQPANSAESPCDILGNWWQLNAIGI